MFPLRRCSPGPRAFICRAAILNRACRVVLPLLTLLSPAAGSPPEELQSRAAARVSEYRQQILKTGDKAAHAPELRTALEEFDAAFRAFDAAGDVGRAAVCRINDPERRRALRHDRAASLHRAVPLSVCR